MDASWFRARRTSVLKMHSTSSSEALEAHVPNMSCPRGPVAIQYLNGHGADVQANKCLAFSLPIYFCLFWAFSFLIMRGVGRRNGHHVGYFYEDFSSSPSSGRGCAGLCRAMLDAA